MFSWWINQETQMFNYILDILFLISQWNVCFVCSLPRRSNSNKKIQRTIVDLALCCFVIYSTGRFVLCLTLCYILFLCFSVLLALRLPRLGKREPIVLLFVCLFDLCLFVFVGFLFLFVSGKGCGLWLWHSLDFSLTFLYDQKDIPYLS